jgi:Cu-Zn family superoxide dismutase
LGSLADGRNSGDATQGHFIGTFINRPSGTLQEVGAIGDSKPIWADQFGFARGEFIDTNIRLNGPNGIIGRSIVVHGDGVSAATRIAQCAIGKRAETSTYDADINPVGQPANFATAHVVYTNLAGNQVLLGYVTFTQFSPDNQVGVTFNFDGLTPNGQHPWHVHQFGDLLSWDTVGSTAGHFIGQNPVRGVGKKQEVGLLNDGTLITADANGHAAGSFTDSQIKLSGINSIVGRAIVVHMSPDGVPRIAWGVIGLSPYNAAGLLRPSFLVILAAIVCALKW